MTERSTELSDSEKMALQIINDGGESGVPQNVLHQSMAYRMDPNGRPGRYTEDASIDATNALIQKGLVEQTNVDPKQENVMPRYRAVPQEQPQA